MSDKEIALENEILRGLVGSQAYGTSLSDNSDRDEMGVFIEPPECVCGLSTVDHYKYRTQPEGVRSGVGDLDLTLYSLRKFTYLARQGNPSILILLWLSDYINHLKIADKLIENRQEFISKEAGKRFLGYSISQKLRFTGERARTVSRPELVEKYGYDTKFAMHAVRLGLQGIELLDTYNLSVPTKQPDLNTLLCIRKGELSYKQVVDLINVIEFELREKIERCDLKVNRDLIDKILIEMHQEWWELIK